MGTAVPAMLVVKLIIGSDAGLGSSMTDTDQNEGDTYSEAETVARREAALRNMLATPHKPHSASKKGRRESQVK
jgi:hypothetical protein